MNSRQEISKTHKYVVQLSNLDHTQSSITSGVSCMINVDFVLSLASPLAMDAFRIPFREAEMSGEAVVYVWLAVVEPAGIATSGGINVHKVRII